MVRPHPAVWRIVHGAVVIYLLTLVFVLFQNVADARLLLRVHNVQHCINLHYVDFPNAPPWRSFVRLKTHLINKPLSLEKMQRGRMFIL